MFKRNFLFILLFILYVNSSFSQDFFTESEITPLKTLQIINDKIYFAYRNAFIIGELTDPLHFREIGSINIGAKIYGIKIYRNYAYLSLGKKGFHIIIRV